MSWKLLATNEMFTNMWVGFILLLLLLLVVVVVVVLVLAYQETS